MKTFLLSVSVVLISLAVKAQDRYFTRTAHISFFSETPVENIEAHNQSATCVLDATTGELEFSALMKSFAFEKALMQEHFNENYVESEKYPKATFKGKITDVSSVNFKQDGAYTTTVSGDLTLHGVTKSITTPATITVRDGNVKAQAQFMVKPGDFAIEIPSVVESNIAKEIEVKVNTALEPLKR